MKTIYETKNGDFSDKAHKAAQQQLYPKLFDCDFDKLSFESVTLHDSNSERNRILDGELAVDRIVKVSIKSVRFPLSFTIQERFRRVKFMPYQDITITEYNHASNKLSELYKLSGGLFVYGYYNEPKNEIDQFVSFSSSALLLKFVRGSLKMGDMRQNRKRQTFIPITFEDIRESGLMLYEYKK